MQVVPIGWGHLTRGGNPNDDPSYTCPVGQFGPGDRVHDRTFRRVTITEWHQRRPKRTGCRSRHLTAGRFSNEQCTGVEPIGCKHRDRGGDDPRRVAREQRTRASGGTKLVRRPRTSHASCVTKRPRTQFTPTVFGALQMISTPPRPCSSAMVSPAQSKTQSRCLDRIRTQRRRS